jgi:hypothetical protein
MDREDTIAIMAAILAKSESDDEWTVRRANTIYDLVRANEIRRIRELGSIADELEGMEIRE